MVLEPVQCPDCQSVDVVKHGRSAAGKQRYCCRNLECSRRSFILNFSKVLLRRGSDQILGATIVARHAGEMISEVTLAMVRKQGLKVLSQVIHPYPTQALAIKQAADKYYQKTFLNPMIQFVLKLAAKFS